MNLEKTSDEDIVKKVQNGDAQKFGEIITRFEAKLKRYIYRMIGSNFELEDILQDVFLKSYKNIQSFNSKMKFSSWIYRIAHNESVNYLKKARKQREQGGLEDNMQKDNGEESMYEKAEKDTGIELIKGCIEKLPAKYKEIILLRYGEDKSYEEISDILRKPVSTIGTLINRATDKLKFICNEKENGKKQ